MLLAKIKVRGVVQGVGFRPFIYRLAHRHQLNGWVRNTSGNVEIEVEGEDNAVHSFLKLLDSEAPPLARIENIEASFQGPTGYANFEIRGSATRSGKYQMVSPDIATCPDCTAEIFNPDDRRYRYPFTNCTNCGPRFTIIEDIPYDRPKTTMSKFKMCPDCQREYEDPLNRRFHAQPNACPRCGPSLELLDANGNPVAGDDVIRKSADLLREGKILALRGLGGFQLTCDATDETAVNALRSRKKRPAKPFAVMVSDICDAEKHCIVSRTERELLESPEAPIVLLPWRRDDSSVTGAVAPNLRYLGLMLPYTPLHHLLLRDASLPLVMTSGNLSEEPIAKDNDEAVLRLSGIADYFLVHNRDIYARYDDSVFMVIDEILQPVRRARGYAPYPITLPRKSRQILACGAEEKNTFCLTRDEHAFISQHIGDMENEETLEHFERTVALYRKLFRVEPGEIACDMHPEYLATKYARQLAIDDNLPLVEVQHHHAHIASCLADNGSSGPVIGVAFDGTGYGPDGAIWGGEFLIADYQGFKRAGHLEYVPLPGAAAAIRRPYRMALSYLFALLGEDFSLTGLPLKQLNLTEVEIVKRQLKRGLNSPLTSSAGRLFDAVSALAGIREEADYEAQAAIELEMRAMDAEGASDEVIYPLFISSAGGENIVKLRELILTVVKDVREGIPVPLISLRFHRSLARMITGMCRLLRQESELNEVALSGGVFQNRLLFKLTVADLRKEGFKVLTHRLVPCNDGGISLGQAVIADFRQRS